MTAIEPVKILLFYKFTPIADPEAIRLWQRTLCENLELTGRIIISKDGINGTVGGSLSAIKKYRRSTCEFAPFRDIDFKWSDGIGDDFPRLAVRVREEIVTFGVPDEVVVDHRGIVGGATHLTPHELHTLVDQRGDEIVFFDGRNEFESRIGRFKNAVIPNIKTTPEFVQELETGKFDHLKDKPIVTYCTGGIRCEVLSVIMKNRGFQEVYQMAGGIVRYAETFGDSHLWEGSLYVFDSRLKMDFSANPQIIGKCQSCDEPTNQFHNCSDPACHTLTLVCDSCWQLHPLVQCETCLA